jgi:uncharacterized alpha-E superfamily protein
LEQVQAYENVLWANVLRSVSGYLMYLQHVQTQIKSEGVIRFLLNDTQFPRSIQQCLYTLSQTLNYLPDGDEVRLELVSLSEYLRQWTQFEAGSKELHDYLDSLQLALNNLNQAIYQAWFIPKHKVA